MLEYSVNPEISLVRIRPRPKDVSRIRDATGDPGPIAHLSIMVLKLSGGEAPIVALESCVA